MAMPDRNGGALAGVRLTDVPLKIRRRYGAILYERAIKELEPLAAMKFGLDIERAIEEPSDRVYWVSAAEVKRVLSPPAPKLRRRR
jgi:hypothetical protein